MVSEDDLIDNIIIPIFSNQGYYVHRRNTHGPGEHGADIIFYRYVKLFQDFEYVVVQAKAEKATAQNVSKFAGQINRAHKIPIPGKAHASIFANYVLFINSKMHTNDANFEMHYLTDVRANTKILTQDQLVELIFEFNVVPKVIEAELEYYKSKSTDEHDQNIMSVLVGNDNNKINDLLDHQLKIDTREISPDVKAAIINYVFKKWDEDHSWEGTAKPMGWLNYYFDFIQPSQYGKLLKVFNEYVSSYPSRQAQGDTFQVIKKITPIQIHDFIEDFMKIMARDAQNGSKVKSYPLLKTKFKEYLQSKLLPGNLKKTSKVIEDALNISEQLLGGSKIKEDERKKLQLAYRELNLELHYYLYPEERE
ncbi:hypothetical protein GCM10022289_45070 [Pedobacter jeongneungensis]|uniref:Restriction endonuclease n=2 Tax=Pedobacter jeongneungensis TaxID=947309 RepID=A0ABP8BQF8_9SPHI